MPNAVIPVSPGQPADSQLQVAATRARQTERPPKPFHDVLAGGVSLSAERRRGRHPRRGRSGDGGGRSRRPDRRDRRAGRAEPAPARSRRRSATSNRSLNDGQASNLQLLALQQQIQNESQQFSTVSNVMRARYDTAKAAVSNIRA